MATKAEILNAIDQLTTTHTYTGVWVQGREQRGLNSARATWYRMLDICYDVLQLCTPSGERSDALLAIAQLQDAQSIYPNSVIEADPTGPTTYQFAPDYAKGAGKVDVGDSVMLLIESVAVAWGDPTVMSIVADGITDIENFATSGVYSGRSTPVREKLSERRWQLRLLGLLRVIAEDLL